ncbi:MAG TPA: thioredoxin domain-containing protein [bacterium]|nr:thioredoxin domain-containing protein [bacterium]
MAERLKSAASAYLQSAVEQPVDWHPWGSEAFERARREDKPILLDIGGAWCHWCHVIDHESYEDPQTAEIINREFVAIKVDRDERPDVDARYQPAVQAISGQGGWPLTAFLMPDGRVFFGGTYFPPTDAYGRPSFKRVLLSAAQYYRENREDAEKVAADLTRQLGAALVSDEPGDLVPALVDRAVEEILRAFDVTNGGFGRAPKFPHTGTIDLLIRRAFRTKDEQTLNVITRTLEKMGRGGVYDQLGGGFHRYSVDAHWIVPHFEKMLYDNAGLLRNYVHGYQLTGEPFIREIALGIYEFLRTTLWDEARGGFSASQDADIGPHDDGDYYTWTLDEVRAALPDDDEYRVAILHYNVNERGEMQHDPRRNVLFVEKDPDAISVLTGLSEERVQALLASAKARLVTARAARPTPFIDRTIYAAWNGMGISAFFDVFTGLQVGDARTFALRALDRILADAYRPGEGVLHMLTAEAAAHPGLLEDQVQIGEACLDAFEVTAEPRYLEIARDLADYLLREFEDPAGGFVDFARGRQTDPSLAVPSKPVQDAPTPGANAVAALMLLRLARLLEAPSYRDAAERTLRAFAGGLARHGLYASTFFLALEDLIRDPAHVVIVAREADLADGRDDGLARRLHTTALATFRPGKIVAVYPHDGVADSHRAAATPPLPESVRAMAASAGGTRAYVCAGTACAPPTTEPDALAELIRTFNL